MRFPMTDDEQYEAEAWEEVQDELEAEREKVRKLSELLGCLVANIESFDNEPDTFPGLLDAKALLAEVALSRKEDYL